MNEISIKEVTQYRHSGARLLGRIHVDSYVMKEYLDMNYDEFEYIMRLKNFEIESVYKSMCDINFVVGTILVDIRFVGSLDEFCDTMFMCTKEYRFGFIPYCYTETMDERYERNRKNIHLDDKPIWYYGEVKEYFNLDYKVMQEFWHFLRMKNAYFREERDYGFVTRDDAKVLYKEFTERK